MFVTIKKLQGHLHQKTRYLVKITHELISSTTSRISLLNIVVNDEEQVVTTVCNHKSISSLQGPLANRTRGKMYLRFVSNAKEAEILIFWVQEHFFVVY